MPFDVFRQHQRKLLAVFAILAMIGFVLSDTLPRWMDARNSSAKNSVVADIDGQKIRRSDLNAIAEQRERANRFMVYAGKNPDFFGKIQTQDLLDALILEKEADRLGIPRSSEFARKWIDQQTFGAMNAQTFEFILTRLDRKVSGEQLLIDVASQVRIALARQQIALPVVTPLDVFRNYRDQTERASFKAVPVVVSSFTEQVGEPTDAEVKSLFEEYKNVLPDPSSPTPGFKEPRRVRVESLSIDARALARSIKAKLPEDELKAYYETRKTDFKVDTELPADLFQGEPKLTPVRYQSFAELRDLLADALSREKAEDEVQDTFAKVRDEAVDAFSNRYDSVIDEINEAKKEGRSTDAYKLPEPESLEAVAKKYGLTREVTPLMDRVEAEVSGRIADARAGSNRSREGKKFADLAFDPKTGLYEGFELSDVLGYRYLARKTADIAAHVPELSPEVKLQVARAWKVEKARPLAVKAADELAAKVRGEGGVIKSLTIDNRPVLAIDNVSKMKAGVPVPSQFNGQFMFTRGPASATSLPQIPDAGPDLLDALFDLKPGDVVVRPDKPITTYYVLTLEHRDPVSFASLLGPNGAMASYWSETLTEIDTKSYQQAMTRMREQAKLKLEAPLPDEKKDDESTE
jgi:peptidyl-prolyl cis-trans isomerase D